MTDKKQTAMQELLGWLKSMPKVPMSRDLLVSKILIGIEKEKQQQIQMNNIVKEIRVGKLLDGMMESDMKLYEQILDTSGFAFYFNELVKLAQK